MFSGQINSLVTLDKLNDHSIENWPTLAHFIGVPGIIADVETDEDGKHYYYVFFEPVSSQPEDVGADWYLDEDEIKRIVLKVGEPASFRANPGDIPLPVKITEVTQTSENPTIYYGFVGQDGEEMHMIPEQFFRPAFNFLILDGGEDGKQKDSESGNTAETSSTD